MDRLPFGPDKMTRELAGAKMKTIAVILAVLSSMAGMVHAAPTLFTFDDGSLASGDGDVKLSIYMSLRYPSWVLVNGAEVHTGDGFNSSLYIWTRAQLLNPGNIRIILGVPTTSVSFDSYVFNATTGADFTFTAYDQTGNIILQQSWNANVSGLAGSYDSGPLATPAYSLNFSDNGKHDVGVDNLVLSAVPAPGAAAHAALALALLAPLRRRRG
jgi:hypothetical protein